MASTTKQQNYRRLMKEVKSSSQPKKIDHPLARYNALDQLSCIVCQQAIKSELLWSTHLKSRRHKETMAELKSKKDVLLQQQKAAVISGRGEGGGGGRGDGVEGEGQTDDRATVTNPPPPLVSVLKKTKREVSSNSDAGTSDEDDQPPAKKHKVTFSNAVDMETTPVEKSSVDVVAKTSAAAVENSSLPADFFDQGVSKRLGEDGDDSDSGEGGRSGDTVKTNSKPLSKSNAGESSQPNSKNENLLQETAIPEGFFDDPKMDAKARKVEYKDKMEEEWERFQKTIQKENDVSEAIRFEDDEEVQGERDFSEIQEQVECFQKAEALRLKQEEILERKSKEGASGDVSSREGKTAEFSSGLEVVEKGGSGDEGGSSEDELMDELEMNWRAKHS